ncbi:MAG: hypothetical protein AAB610_03120 [Patescibacteria group bacterium]
MKIIPLSKHLGVARKVLEKVGVFDATLGLDTKLFVDPKLLVSSDIPELRDSRKRILDYFTTLLRIHKQSHKSPRLRNQARDMLAVPEPEGVSIGYGSKSDNGTSVPKPVANKILLSVSEIFSVGIEDAEVVELLSLFVPKFGPDSISDLIISIIYSDLCKYTERVSLKLGVKTRQYTIEGSKYFLPTHPFTNEQIIFIPYSLLSVLPVAASWDQIANAAARNESLRKQLEDIVQPALEKIMKDISQGSQKEKEAFKKDMSALLDVYRKVEVKSYDLNIDEKGYYKIDPFIEKQSSKIKAHNKPKNASELINSIRDLTTQFKRTIEDNGGSNLLYHRTKTGKILKKEPHHEDVSQKIFYMIADLFCRQANILLSGESDAGRGPVDFSLGTGYQEKVLVEIKKSNNKNLESGYKKQLEAYEKSENAQYSFFVVILVKKQPKKNDSYSQLDIITKLCEENKKANKKCPELVIVDGLVKPSPSKLKVVKS